MKRIKSLMLCSSIIMWSCAATDGFEQIRTDSNSRNSVTIDFGPLNAIPAAQKRITITLEVSDDLGKTYCVLDMFFTPGATMSDAVADLAYVALVGSGWSVTRAGDDTLTIGCRNERGIGGFDRYELLAVRFEVDAKGVKSRPKIETTGIAWDISP